MAQLYVLTLGVTGVYTAALSPVALALRGPRAAMAEQTTATVLIWGTLVVLKLTGVNQVAWAYAAGLIAAAGVVYALTQGQIRVPIVKVLSKPLGLLAFSLAVSFGGMAQHVSPWIVAPLAAIVPAFVLAERGWAGRTMIPAALRELRGNGGDRKPMASGAAS